MSATVIKLWTCTNCKALNAPAASYCSACKRHRLNLIGNWPRDSWFQRRLMLVRLREYERALEEAEAKAKE